MAGKAARPKDTPPPPPPCPYQLCSRGLGKGQDPSLRCSLRRGNGAYPALHCPPPPSLPCPCPPPAGVPLVVVRPGRQVEKQVARLSDTAVPRAGQAALEEHRAAMSSWEGRENSARHKVFRGGSRPTSCLLAMKRHGPFFCPQVTCVTMSHFLFTGILRSPTLDTPNRDAVRLWTALGPRLCCVAASRHQVCAYPCLDTPNRDAVRLWTALGPRLHRVAATRHQVCAYPCLDTLNCDAVRLWPALGPKVCRVAATKHHVCA